MNEFLRRVNEWLERASVNFSAGLTSSLEFTKKYGAIILRFLGRNIARGSVWTWRHRDDVTRWTLGVVFLAIGVWLIKKHGGEVPWAWIAVGIGLLVVIGLGLWILIWVSYKLAEWNDRRKKSTPTPPTTPAAPPASPKTSTPSRTSGVSGTSSLQGALWVMLLMTFGLMLVGYVLHTFLWLPTAVMAVLLVLSYIFKPHTQTRDGYVPKWYRLKLAFWLVAITTGIVLVSYTVFVQSNPLRTIIYQDKEEFFHRHPGLTAASSRQPGDQPVIHQLSNGVTEVILPTDLNGVYDTGLSVWRGQPIEGIVLNSTFDQSYNGQTYHMSTTGMLVPTIYSPNFEIIRPMDIKEVNRRQYYAAQDAPVASLLLTVGDRSTYIGNGSWNTIFLPHLWEYFNPIRLPVKLQLNIPHQTDQGLRGYVRVWLRPAPLGRKNRSLADSHPITDNRR